MNLPRATYNSSRFAILVKDRSRRSFAIVREDSISKRCTENDVLIARYGASLGRIVTGRKGAYNVALAKVIFDRDQFFHRYLFHLLQTEFFQTPIHMISRSAQNGFNKGDLAEIWLPVAPPDEQRRIVAEIEKQLTRLDAGVASLKRVQAALKRYRASVLKAACEGRLVPTEAELARQEGRTYESAAELLKRLRVRYESHQVCVRRDRSRASGRTPKNEKFQHDVSVSGGLSDLKSEGIQEGWVWATIEQLRSPESNSITDGPFGSNLKTEHYTASGPRVIRLQNVGEGVFIDALAHISQEHFIRLAKHRVFAGDLVIAALGENLPRSCIVPESVGDAIVKADCIRFRPDAAISISYLNCALNSEPIRKRTKTIVHGVGRPRLNLSEIKSILLPIPPAPEQQRISEEVERRFSIIEELENTVASSLKRAERLRQSILYSAFTGKL